MKKSKYYRDGEGKLLFRGSKIPVKATVKAEVTYTWISVKADENNVYSYPNKVTSYMNKNYHGPQVYHWYIHREKPVSDKKYYIGETKVLCPNRVQNVLKPGNSQETNKRLKIEFDKLHDEGYQVNLDILSVDKMSLCGYNFTNEDLEEAIIRKIIENMLIVDCQHRRIDMLNLWGQLRSD